MDTIEHAKPRQRRRHDRQLKRQVLAECAAPSASVATVAMAYGLNANLVHKWRRQARAEVPVAPPFIPVQVDRSPSAEAASCVDLEVQRGAVVVVRVRWPLSAMASCAAWLRELLH